MRRLRTMGAVAALAATGSLAAAPPALAEDFECRGPLGALAIAGNVIVPDDSVCTLDGTQVDGSITVKSRASSTPRGSGPPAASRPQAP